MGQIIIAFHSIQSRRKCTMRTSKYNKALTIALPQDHFEQVKKITDEKKISLAEFVRAAVAAALNNIEREGEMTNDQ
jgi:hypothetical protein